MTRKTKDKPVAMKPCPFCAAPEPRRSIEVQRGRLVAVIRCSQCGASHATAIDAEAERAEFTSVVSAFAELRDRWNRRTEPLR